MRVLSRSPKTGLLRDLCTGEVPEWVRKRDAFVKSYCKKKGWVKDGKDLTTEQIFEIRAQPEWKNMGN